MLGMGIVRFYLEGRREDGEKLSLFLFLLETWLMKNRSFNGDESFIPEEDPNMMDDPPIKSNL